MPKTKSKVKKAAKEHKRIRTYYLLSDGKTVKATRPRDPLDFIRAGSLAEARAIAVLTAEKTAKRAKSGRKLKDGRPALPLTPARRMTVRPTKVASARVITKKTPVQVARENVPGSDPYTLLVGDHATTVEAEQINIDAQARISDEELAGLDHQDGLLQDTLALVEEREAEGTAVCKGKPAPKKTLSFAAYVIVVPPEATLRISTTSGELRISLS